MVDALKQTITLTALRLGTFRLFFSASFFPYSWNGQWNNRPLGSFDMNSPLETLVREVIRSADKNTSPVESCTVCECEHYPFSIEGPLAIGLWWSEIPARWLDLLLSHCTAQVIPFISAAATKLQGRTANSWQFPAARNRMKPDLGLRWASNVTSANSQASFRNKG